MLFCTDAAQCLTSSRPAQGSTVHPIIRDELGACTRALHGRGRESMGTSMWPVRSWIWPFNFAQYTHQGNLLEKQKTKQKEINFWKENVIFLICIFFHKEGAYVLFPYTFYPVRCFSALLAFFSFTVACSILSLSCFLNLGLFFRYISYLCHKPGF